jgi:nucleoside-diphosphate kinase
MDPSPASNGLEASLLTNHDSEEVNAALGGPDHTDQPPDVPDKDSAEVDDILEELVAETERSEAEEEVDAELEELLYLVIVRMQSEKECLERKVEYLSDKINMLERYIVLHPHLESLPPCVDSPPSAPQTPPAAQQSPPAAQESPPAAQQSPPAAQQSPPSAPQTPPRNLPVGFVRDYEFWKTQY